MAMSMAGGLCQKIDLAHGNGLMHLWMSADVFCQEGETKMFYNISHLSGISFCRAFKGGLGYVF